MRWYPPVLNLTNYRRLYFAGLTSELGAFITETALMLLVFSLVDQNKAYLGATRACFLAMLTLGSLAGGPLGEKFNRRSLLIFANAARIPLIFALMFVDQVWFIILTNGLIAFFTGVYNPSRQAVINEVVPQKNINQANSLFGSTMAILHLAGPFIGASLYAYFRGVEEVLILDLLAFVVGLFLLTRMNYTPLKDRDTDLTQAPLTFMGNLKEGFNYIIQRRDLRALLINASVAGLCIGVLVPLLLPFVTEVLGEGEREYGLLLSLFGLGGLFGGLVANRLCERFKTGRVVLVLLCFEPLAMLMWINSQTLILNYTVIAFWGLLVFARIPSQLNYISETVETRYLTRVHSLLDMAFVVPNISGGIIVAFLGAQFSTYTILAVVTATFMTLTYPRLFTKDVRTLFASNAKKVVRHQED